MFVNLKTGCNLALIMGVNPGSSCLSKYIRHTQALCIRRVKRSQIYSVYEYEFLQGAIFTLTAAQLAAARTRNIPSKSSFVLHDTQASPGSKERCSLYIWSPGLQKMGWENCKRLESWKFILVNAFCCALAASLIHELPTRIRYAASCFFLQTFNL